MKTRKLATGLLLVVSLALAGAVILAEEPAKDKDATAQAAKEKKKKKDGTSSSPAREAPVPPVVAPDATAEPVHVYTNADLDRLAPRSPSSAGTLANSGEKGAKDGAKSSSEPSDALKQIEDDKSRAADRATRVAEAEKNLAAADARVRGLEQRSLAVKNPFLPRPQVPPDQADQWSKMKSSERLKATEDEIK
jgi:hypothetical protein